MQENLVGIQPEFKPEIKNNQPKNSNLVITLLALALLISTLIAAFFAYQTQLLVRELNNLKIVSVVSPVPSSEPMTTSSPEIEQNQDWKKYTNKVLNYSIQYPSDWILDKSQAELPVNDQNSQQLIISKAGYNITIRWPSAYGPGICIFDDQSRVGVPEMASYCSGKYVETKNSLGTIIHRRLAIPNEYNEFEVYTFDGKYYVTVPPIRFKVPANYDNETVKLMDQILSTYVKFD